MLKGFSDSVATTATKAKNGITEAAKESLTSISDFVSDKVSSTGDAAIRASVAQLKKVLDIAVDEYSKNPSSIANGAISASVNIGVISLQIEVSLSECKTPTHPKDGQVIPLG